MKLFFLGNKEECLGFSLAGAQSIQVRNEDDFVETMEKLLKEKDTGVIIAADRFFEVYSLKFSKKRKKKAVPAVVFVPSIEGKHIKRDIKGYISGVLGIRL
ncbi:V-type ATP synthase subunit F [Nitrosophilus alvini]|uniref:V-type ATP synthase subunit F n=1 Tax=Nitrosophilus alvini TaxID=2714855 RepID=UPI00190913B7|nr:V-type ATP synthase subunit F [Nitrosophilus alvini]